jgi:hypothetical protein
MTKGKNIYRYSIEMHKGRGRVVRKLIVLNCGGGRQSAMLALWAAERHMAGEHLVDVVIMADTGNERAATLAYWKLVIVPALDQAGIPHFVVTAGEYRSTKGKSAGKLRRSGEGIAADALRSVREGTPIANAPWWAAKKGKGSKGVPLKRLCTSEYKIVPITRKIREILKLRPGQRAITKDLRCEVVQMIGIAKEEEKRAKGTMTTQAWVKLTYPLLDANMTTDDCLAWLTRHGYPSPVKSACIVCPYRSTASWARMKRDDPASFAEAVDFDRKLRDPLGLGRMNDGLSLADYYDGKTPTLKGAEHAAYVHPSCTPLDELALDQIGLDDETESFGGEC